MPTAKFIRSFHLTKNDMAKETLKIEAQIDEEKRAEQAKKEEEKKQQAIKEQAQRAEQAMYYGSMETENFRPIERPRKIETFLDVNAYLNPHKNPAFKIAYTNKKLNGEVSAGNEAIEPNFDAASAMGASIGYLHDPHIQQDRTFIGTIENSDLVRDQIPQILLNTNLLMGQKCYQKELERNPTEEEIKGYENKKNRKRTAEEIEQGAGKKPMGSTAVACLIFDSQVFVSNVGDSRAVLIKRKKPKPGETIQPFTTWQRLTVTHTCADPDEKKRIENAGGEIKKGVKDPRHKLNSKGFQIEPSRAYGDIEFEKGLTWAPSIPSPITVDDDEEAYVVLFSDGIYEKTSEDDLLEIFNEEENNDERARKILQDTENKREEEQKRGIDNKSVIIVPLEQKNLNPGQGVLAVVADGHGGAGVSDYVAQNFAPIMQNEIDKTCQRYFQFINDLEKRIQELRDESKKCGWLSFFGATADVKLRNDKISILEMFINIVKQIKPTVDFLPSLIQLICTIKLSDLKQGKYYTFDFEDTEYKTPKKQIYLKIASERKYDERATVYDLLLERRMLSIFNASKPVSAQLIAQYSKPTEADVLRHIENVESRLLKNYGLTLMAKNASTQTENSSNAEEVKDGKKEVENNQSVLVR